MSKFTTLLFARPSFRSGMARAVDISGAYVAYNHSESAEAADGVAIASDWYAVGADLLVASKKYADAHPIEAKHGRANGARPGR